MSKQDKTKIFNFFKPLISVNNPKQMWFILLAICLANFMFNFYIGLINVSLPTITEYFSADVMTTTWISNCYLLTLTISVIFLGRVGGLWSRKYLFLMGTVIWVIMALCNAYLANSAEMLIVYRSIQGIAAGFMASVYYTILDRTFPKEKLGMALGFLLVALSGGYAIGPLLGGWITAYLGWRMIFLFTIPLGLLSIVVYLITAQKAEADIDEELMEKCYKRQKKDKLSLKTAKFRILDMKGGILQAVVLFTLVFALIQIQKFGLSALNIGLLVVTILFGGILVWVEARHDEPLFRFNIFRSITFSAYTMGLLFNYIVLYMFNFTMPFYLQKIAGYKVDTSGYIISMVMFAAMFLSIIAGTLADKIGVKPLAILASIACIISSTMMSAYNVNTSFTFMAMGLVALGVGYGLYQSPNNKMLLSVTPDRFKTQVSSMMTLTKNLGSVMGNVFAALILATVISQTALSDKVIFTGQTAIQFTEGFHGVFLIAVLFSILMLISTFDLQKYVAKLGKETVKTKLGEKRI